MDNLIDRLREDYPEITFTNGDVASWSSQANRITYNSVLNDKNCWGLLHEMGHALLHHEDFKSDLDLLQKEMSAWDRATRLACHYNIIIANDHIQDCLDTYRDWLHKRSSCPHCLSLGLQQYKTRYACPNCKNTWEVSNSRFCRPYRLQKA